MPRGKKKVEVYHCDGFYFHNVCQFRGNSDAADDHQRFLCTNYGLDDKDKLCRHCVEHRKLFRREPTRINGRVESLTPYQAKDAEAVTQQAFTGPKPLIAYLKTHRSLYGVNVKTGVMIDAPAVEGE